MYSYVYLLCGNMSNLKIHILKHNNFIETLTLQYFLQLVKAGEPKYSYDNKVKQKVRAPSFFFSEKFTKPF